MNLYQFNGLPIDQRAKCVWQHGKFLAIRNDKPYSIVLYHMGEFFAEVWYSFRDTHIAMIRGFRSRALLDPYLEMIDLAELMGEKS